MGEGTRAHTVASSGNLGNDWVGCNHTGSQALGKYCVQTPECKEKGCMGEEPSRKINTDEEMLKLQRPYLQDRVSA